MTLTRKNKLYQAHTLFSIITCLFCIFQEGNYLFYCYNNSMAFKYYSTDRLESWLTCKLLVSISIDFREYILEVLVQKYICKRYKDKSLLVIFILFIFFTTSGNNVLFINNFYVTLKVLIIFYLVPNITMVYYKSKFNWIYNILYSSHQDCLKKMSVTLNGDMSIGVTVTKTNKPIMT